MKIWIGSVLVIALLGVGFWLLLSPSFKKVGDTAQKVKKYIEEDDDGSKH
ncbi:putative RDD family membrane protein YckC [Oikeobacillus pervagus]|uniref:RDD family membrane protein YckC n=1 Tax=Oikeobacillus pervagus TaxID=1325931 RepID=A0AAJ1T4G9_9BACI|nr:hypothetical protein [Oikeobacillus pervagus]MDQ0214640.1 putative RDD family membrane protein YckC [Oikeobacillus pervagus]